MKINAYSSFMTSLNCVLSGFYNYRLSSFYCNVLGTFVLHCLQKNSKLEIIYIINWLEDLVSYQSSNPMNAWYKPWYVFVHLQKERKSSMMKKC